MNKHLSLVLTLGCAAAFAFGIVQLFKLRFEGGDVYPAYSSLRADPLGTMAFYESLSRTPGLTVERDFRATTRLPDEKVTYLHLAADAEDWRWIPKELSREIEAFLLQGGRLVITFSPETTAPSGSGTAPANIGTKKSAGKTPQPGKETKVNPTPASEQNTNEPAADTADTGIVDFKDRWGVEMIFEKLSRSESGTYESVRVVNAGGLPLPPSLNWHSGTVFTNLDAAWNPIYVRGTHAVMIERRRGPGSMVMATDSFFVSNEAMRLDRHAGLLAWLVGPNRGVVFDEAHFGILDEAGIATLIRKYRLAGLAAGLLLLAGLFVWKNSASLVPAPADPARQDFIAGKDAAAGFVNLLRRNIPAREILNVCFAEWTKSLKHRCHYTMTGIDRAQSVMEAEAARPRRQSDPVRAYQDICHALKRSGIRSADFDSKQKPKT